MHISFFHHHQGRVGFDIVNIQWPFPDPPSREGIMIDDKGCFSTKKKTVKQPITAFLSLLNVTIGFTVTAAVIGCSFLFGTEWGGGYVRHQQ